MLVAIAEQYYEIHFNEFPLSDENIEKLIKIGISDIATAEIYLMGESINIEDIIELHMSPSQKEKVKDHIRKSIKQLENRFKLSE